MDPRTTLDTARADLNANRPRTALESILNYYNWRVCGGFAPYNGDNMARDLAVRIQDALMNEHKEPGEDAPTCDECGNPIPVTESSEVNAHHKPECSLHPSALKNATPKNKHGQTCADTCGTMATRGFHTLLCPSVEKQIDQQLQK